MEQERTGACGYFSQARKQLKDKWCMAALITFLFGAIPSTADFFLQQVFGLTIPVVYYAVTLLFNMGLTIFYLEIARGNALQVSNLWSHFSSVNLLIQSILLYFLQSLIIGFGFFLLIVPGVIFMCMLSMSSYILAENPEINCIEAMGRSVKMMKGRKCRVFLMYLSAFGFILLGLLCLIIGVFFAIPMVSTAFACFYLKNKGQFNPLIPNNE